MLLLYAIKCNTSVASKITLTLCTEIKIYWKVVFTDVAFPVKDIFAFEISPLVLILEHQIL